MREQTAKDIAEAMYKLASKVGVESPRFTFSVVEETGDFGIVISNGYEIDSPLFDIAEILYFFTTGY